MSPIQSKENSLRKIGWIITVGNIIMMFFSANYFLFMSKFPVVPWLFFNACFPSTAIFLIGFFLKNKSVMAFSIPFLTFYGTGGMFVFGWSGGMIMAQISHIFMTLAVVYVLIETIKAKDWKQFVGGSVFGLAAFLVILPIHQNYIRTHPEYLEKMGDAKFENKMKENK